MLSDVDLSVILCVRNGENVIQRQLEAISSQKCEIKFELIIVNNGSTDNTEKIVKKFLQENKRFLPIAKIIDASEKSGLPFARNKGIQSSQGKVLAFCDADDRVHEGWVQAIYDSLKDRDALIGGRNHTFDESGKKLVLGIGEGLLSTNYLPHVSGCNFAITRKAVFASGGFDESLPRYGFDDVDFSWRVQETGFPIDYEPHAEVDFTVSGNSSSVKKRFLLGKGRVLMARRYPQYDGASYSLGYCVKKIAVITSSIFKRLARERTLNRRELSMLVAAVGNLYGSLYYSGSDKKPAPKLINS